MNGYFQDHVHFQIQELHTITRKLCGNQFQSKGGKARIENGMFAAKLYRTYRFCIDTKRFINSISLMRKPNS